MEVGSILRPNQTDDDMQVFRLAGIICLLVTFSFAQTVIDARGKSYSEIYGHLLRYGGSGRSSRSSRRENSQRDAHDHGSGNLVASGSVQTTLSKCPDHMDPYIPAFLLRAVPIGLYRFLVLIGLSYSHPTAVHYNGSLNLFQFPKL